MRQRAIACFLNIDPVRKKDSHTLTYFSILPAFSTCLLLQWHVYRPFFLLFALTMQITLARKEQV
jgi:hypothetical protein